MEETRLALRPGNGAGTAFFTALAPIAWGSTYFVTEAFLPPDRPLFGAAVRALPTGLVMLALARQLPRGDWWWKAAVLGLLNIGAFFPLIFLAAYHLPGGLAATITATSPIAVMVLARALIAERPAALSLVGALVGVLGVALLVLGGGATVSWLGVAASLGAIGVSSVGYVLVKRWRPPVDMVTLASWQLVAGGLVLAPLAYVVEGPAPDLDTRSIGGFLFLCTFGTGLAYIAWFTGLRALPAGAVSLIGLLNPVVGTALGVFFAHEVFGVPQAVGMVLVLGGVLLGQPAVQALLRGRLARATSTTRDPAAATTDGSTVDIEEPTLTRI